MQTGLNVIDIILLILIIGLCVFIVYRQIKKKNECSHICSTCSSTTCKMNDFIKDINEARENNKK